MAERLAAEEGGAGLRLTAEFAALYVGLPLVMALALPAEWLWPVFAGAVALALGLLAPMLTFAG